MERGCDKESRLALTHERTFRVRHHECDARGTVSYTNYLRYMQETAFDATAAAGYSLARYEAMDRIWLARETDIEYVHPLRYGDSVQVKTWVADFRRVRSIRAYEFYLIGSGDLVARAHTDWVFLDSTTGRPAPIPAEMKTAFFPMGVPAAIPVRFRFPSAPPPPPGVFRMWRRVEWRDLDQVQHVNNAAYLAYIEDCAIQAAAAYGWPPARMQAEGYSVAALRHQLEYRQPAVLNDELELTTWLSDMTDTTYNRHFAIVRLSDGLPVVQARASFMWLNLGTGRPASLPETFLADLAANVAN